jgi:hypothetical protein
MFPFASFLQGFKRGSGTPKIADSCPLGFIETVLISTPATWQLRLRQTHTVTALETDRQNGDGKILKSSGVNSGSVEFNTAEEYGR